jgi:predicted GNAT superfamily acetyltransferase
MDAASVLTRDLTTLDDFRRTVALEKEVWRLADGEEAVPLTLLAPTVRRGAILVGAFNATDRLVGFVYSLPAIKGGRLAHWSHMLGVLPAYRSAGVGRVLKLEQRRRVLDMGLDLIEWTYDPLQAVNAHFNFARLGVIVEEYKENVYGENPSSPLWAGLATDRFVAEWRIATPHVERRIKHTGGPLLRAADTLRAQRVNSASCAGDRLEPADRTLGATAPRLSVVIPLNFAEMQSHDRALALAWRLSTREIFQHYFGRGYRVVDFWLDTSGVSGTYLLARSDGNGQD